MALWEYIREKMRAHPKQVVCENQASMTYEELCIFAESYAGKLDAEYYGVYCNSEMAAAMMVLACIAAGKPVIPFPVRYGREICVKIWERATPPYMITDFDEYLNPTPIPTGKRPKSLPSSTSVVLFTSGSTGTPKGIMLTEKNLLANIKDICSYFPIGTEDTILISRPLYHSSVLTGEFLVSLCAGAKIVFSSEAFHPLRILNLMKENRVTAFGSTPTLMTALSRFVRKPEELSVQLLSISGECIMDGMAKSIRRAFPTAKVYCGYGLSEAAPRVAYLPPDLFDTTPTSAGQPLPSVKIKILRDNGQEASRCEVGEVVVKGPNIMAGYFGDTARTKAVRKNGWLSTGDLGCIGPDGMLYIKGRKDDMIIRAGMNIYPAEIENALSQDGRCRDVQAYGYEKNGTQEIGIAISGDFSSTEEVLQLCRERLSGYQIPTKIEIVKEGERLAGGKRKRLRGNVDGT